VKTEAAEKFDESLAGQRLKKAKHYHQCSDERKLLWEDGEDIPPLLRQNLCGTAKSIELLEARRSESIDDAVSAAIITARKSAEQEDREGLDEKIPTTWNQQRRDESMKAKYRKEFKRPKKVKVEIIEATDGDAGVIT
jgi:hypothetical protein